MAHAVASRIDGAAFGVLIGMVRGALSSGMHPSPAALCALVRSGLRQSAPLPPRSACSSDVP
eukprot:347531-Chlamydomonas_euryale.AAC.1